MVYERGYKANVLVIYITLSTREETDQKLKSFKVGNDTNGRYVSFRGIDSNDRVGYLDLSDMTNIQAKLDILEEVNVQDIITYNNKKYQLRDLLLNIKIRKAPVFIRVE